MQLKHDPPAEHPTSINAPTKTTATATAATILFPLIRQILSPRPRRVPRPRVRGRFSSHIQTALYAKPRLLSIAPANLFIHRRNPFIPPAKRGRPPVAPPIKTAKKQKHIVRRPLPNLCTRDKHGVTAKPRQTVRQQLLNLSKRDKRGVMQNPRQTVRQPLFNLCTRDKREGMEKPRSHERRRTLCGRACERG